MRDTTIDRNRSLARAALVLAALLLAAAAWAQPLVRSAEFGGADPEARRGGNLSYATIAPYSTFNPFTARALSDANRIDLLLPALVAFNSATLENECYLCLSAEVADDGRSVTYVLREGLQWSDGTPLTVDDVLFSARLHANPEINSRLVSSFSLGGQPIVWEQVDERTIVQRMPVVDAAAFDLARWAVVPRHVFEPAFEAGGASAVQQLWGINTPPNELVAGGPFRVRTVRVNEEIVLERNPNYFVQDEAGTQLPYLDTLTFKAAADANAMLAQFLTSEIDIMTLIFIDEVLAVRDAVDAGRVDAVVLAGVTMSASPTKVWGNWQNPNPRLAELFQDVRFRRALSHLSDRQTIIDLAFGGLGAPLYGPFSSGNTRFYDESAFVEGETKFSYDPEAAAVLLAELGYDRRNAQGLLVNASGETIAFNIMGYASAPDHAAVVQVLSDDYREAGLDVTTTIGDTSSVVTPATRNFNDDGTRNFDMLVSGFGGVADPPTRRNLYTLDGPARLWNLARPGEPQPAFLQDFELELVRLANAALATFDESERFAAYAEFQRLAAAQLPFIYLYTPAVSIVYNARVGGTQDRLPNPVSAFEGSQNGMMGQIVNFADVLYVRD
jgi:peptide/nickel transport system substrate-binding protein